MKLRSTLAVPIIFLLVLVALGTLLAGYQLSITTLRESVLAREHEKTEQIHLTVHWMVQEEIQKLRALSEALGANREIADTLIHYSTSGGDLAPLVEVIDRMYSTLDTDGVAVTNSEGVVLYTRGSHREPAGLISVWGMDEALDGEETLAIARSQGGWAVRAFRPIHSSDKILGIVILAVRIDENFAQKIAAATNTHISFAILEGVLASTVAPEERGLIDVKRVWDGLTIEDDKAYFVDDVDTRSVFLYSALRIVDETSRERDSKARRRSVCKKTIYPRKNRLGC